MCQVTERLQLFSNQQRYLPAPPAVCGCRDKTARVPAPETRTNVKVSGPRACLRERQWLQ